MNVPIPIGDIQLTIVSGGRMRLDGGNMFGVIPRVLWEKEAEPDERNRVLLETNCVLVQARDSLGLIDTGYGGKASPKVRQRFALDEGAPLLRNLAAHGVSPSNVDWVVLTHLHFDHAGGCSYRDEHGQLRPTFPRARHFVQRNEWDDAVGELPELAGSYFTDDFLPLADAGLLQIVDGSVEIVPGVTVNLTGGHTRGHQMVVIKPGGQSAICPADICPTTAHLPTFWTMAYDQFPLVVRRRKPTILHDIAQQDSILLFSHDPLVPASRISRRANSVEWTVSPLESA